MSDKHWPDEDDLEEMFTYHAPTEAAKVAHKEIDEQSLDFAYRITTVVPECPERTLSIRYLQMARMWANAAIALNHDKLV